MLVPAQNVFQQFNAEKIDFSAILLKFFKHMLVVLIHLVVVIHLSIGVGISVMIFKSGIDDIKDVSLDKLDKFGESHWSITGVSKK